MLISIRCLKTMKRCGTQMKCISCDTVTTAKTLACPACLQNPHARVEHHTGMIARLNRMSDKATEQFIKTYIQFPDDLLDRFSDMRSAWMWAGYHVKQSVTRPTCVRVFGVDIPEDLSKKIHRTVERDKGMAKLWSIYGQLEDVLQSTQRQIRDHRFAITFLIGEEEKL
jgi:hypothetical protein